MKHQRILLREVSLKPPNYGRQSAVSNLITRKVLLAATLVVAAGGGVISGQNVPTVTKGNIELGVFGGESYGLDRFRPMVGGNLAIGLSRLIYPFVEGSYLPGVARTVEEASNTANNVAIRYKTDLTDFHGGIHFRLVRGETRVIPYLVGGTGVIHASAFNGNASFPSQYPGQPPTFLPFPVHSKTSWEVNFGGGLRFFITERFGIRIEMKAFKPTSAPVVTGAVGPGTGTTALVYRFAIAPYFQVR
jgi:hypothetical protein